METKERLILALEEAVRLHDEWERRAEDAEAHEESAATLRAFLENHPGDALSAHDALERIEDEREEYRDKSRDAHLRFVLSACEASNIIAVSCDESRISRRGDRYSVTFLGGDCAVSVSVGPSAGPSGVVT